MSLVNLTMHPGRLNPTQGSTNGLMKPSDAALSRMTKWSGAARLVSAIALTSPGKVETNMPKSPLAKVPNCIPPGASYVSVFTTPLLAPSLKVDAFVNGAVLTGVSLYQGQIDDSSPRHKFHMARIGECKRVKRKCPERHVREDACLRRKTR
eukprot:1150955-Pelagomonas_calceolata.AAC.1